MHFDPLTAEGRTVGERPEALTDSQIDLIELIYGEGGIDATVWCSRCHRAWRIRDLELHWLEYFDEYGWCCPADGPSTLLSYARLRTESEPVWPLSPSTGQVLELTAGAPEPSADVFALMSAGDHVKAHALYISEARIGPELGHWGFQLGQELWRQRYPVAAREQLLRTPQQLKEWGDVLASERPTARPQDAPS